MSRKPLSLAERIDVVETFNEKSERLDQLSFTKYVRESPVGFRMSAATGGEVSLSSTGPDLESVEAFALTLRLFLQPNEPLSLARFGGIFSALPVSPELIAELDRVSHLVTEFLDRPCQVELNQNRPTNRQVLEVFLFGGLAHTSQRREFRAWQAQPIVFGLLQTVFHGILIESLRYIFWVHDNNKRALDELIAAGEHPTGAA